MENNILYNTEQNGQATDLLMKNKLVPQMRGRREVIDLGNGLVVDTPKREVIANMYGYNFNGKENENE